jgi:hypothetical protein
MFAGFALTLNGLSYVIKMDEKVRAVANILVGIVIGTNAIFQTTQAASQVEFGFSAIMWMFALNYFIISPDLLFKIDRQSFFGVYSLFATAVSVAFFLDSLGGYWEMIVLWAMWTILWLQSTLAILFGIKSIDKLSPHILIFNGVVSTFIPGMAILLGVIL